MGMYDEVEYKADCPKCGRALAGFQSKDGPCTISKLKPEDVRYFYTTCETWNGGCGEWVEFEVVPKQVEIKMICPKK